VKAQRTPSALGGFVLAYGIRGRGVGGLARVVEHLREVENLALVRDFGDAAEQQVVVVATVEPRPEPADRLHELSAVDRQVGDIVLRIEQVSREVRLEVRLTAPAELVELVFIGIDEQGFWPRLERPREGEERVSGEHVVRTQEADVLSPCERERRVEVVGKIAIFFAKDHPHSGITRRVVGNELPDVRRGRRVSDAQLEVRVRLF
jgi:hypothetical protein